VTTFSEIHRKQLKPLGRPIRQQHYTKKRLLELHITYTARALDLFFRKKKKREKENKYGVLRTRHCYSSYTVSPPFAVTPAVVLTRNKNKGPSQRYFIQTIFRRARGHSFRFFRDIPIYLCIYYCMLHQYYMIYKL